MIESLTVRLTRLVAFAGYGAFCLAVILSYLSNSAPSWIDIVALLPVLWPYVALAFFRDDRPLMWFLNSAVTSHNWVFNYVTGTLSKQE